MNDLKRQLLYNYIYDNKHKGYIGETIARIPVTMNSYIPLGYMHITTQYFLYLLHRLGVTCEE